MDTALVKEILPANDLLNSITTRKWIYYGIGYSKTLNRADLCYQDELGTYTCETISGVSYNFNLFIDYY